MSGEALIRELRKLRAHVIHPPDSVRDELVRHLKRIGCQVDTMWPIPERWPKEADIVFCLFGDRSAQDVSALNTDRNGTLIGIIEYESPTVVRELLEAEVHAVIGKPIHPFGILSTLTIASSRYRFERRQNNKIAKLEETLRSRRVVNNAVRYLATERSIDEDQAYQIIRRWSLEGRASMTSVADKILESAQSTPKCEGQTEGRIAMEPPKTSDSILRVALDWEVDGIDPPASFGGWNTGRVVQQMFESLYEDDLEDETANPTRLLPTLATSVDISADGLKYLFHLREGIRFHDGTPFDAEAAKFNIDRMWDASSSHYSPIAADYNRIGLEGIKSVEVTAPNELLITLKEPFPEFLRYMTQEDAPGAHVYISPKAVKNHGNLGLADHAPGTGPFCFDSRFPTPLGSGVRLRRNEDYWGGLPKLKSIEFRPYPELENRYEALINGEVDVAYGLEGSDLDELERRGFVVREGEVPYIWYFIFNMRDPVLLDLRVRRAIAHAVDREELSKSVFRGHTSAASGMLPPASPAFDEKFVFPYEYNPERARELLTQANVPSGWRLRIKTASAGSGQLMPMRICEHLAKSLEAVGFGAEVIPTDDWVSYCNEWRSGLPDGIGASQMSWGMSCDVWLEQVLHSRNSSPFGFNAGYYSNPAVDRLLEEARQTQNDGRRTQLYRDANRLIMEELPTLPMLTLRRGSVCYHPRVRGLRNARQNWHSFMNVWTAPNV